MTGFDSKRKIALDRLDNDDVSAMAKRGEHMKKYLIALPCFRGQKGFNCQTILVSAKNERDAIALTRHLRPNTNIGEIKHVINQEKTK